MGKREFLKEVYEADEQSDLKSLYNEWSDSYDNEMDKQGYETPKRCAEALASCVDDLSETLLDYGCGTGVSGLALSDAGFTSIDGCDISPKMLDEAVKKEVYRNTWTCHPENPTPFNQGTYRHITAVGVISVGAAPITLMDDLYSALPTGGTLTFSFNDHTLNDPQYEHRLYEYIDTAAAHLLFKDYGEHLPGMGMMSEVYVMQKN